ncbi:M48 family metalloprotease, partial [candidate division GN15 bacterium]|nr:M48 family metalloprotease [candidate division GN15 bacterium]
MATDTTQTDTIPQRQDIDEQHKWNLADIYATDDAWEADFGKARELIEQAESFRGRLAESARVLWDCLQSRSTLQQTLSSLFQYAYLNKDLDNRVSKYQEMTERVAMLGSHAGAAYSFVEPELLAIDEAQLRGMADQFPQTDVYDFYIKELLRSKKHIRSGEVEEVMAMMSVVSRGPDNIFAMLDDADITYPSILDENGNQVQLTKQRYAKFLDSKDRRVRRDANEAFYSSYRAHVNTLSASLSTSVNQDIFYARVRRYENALHSALDGDNIPLSVYHQLLDTTEKNLKALHNYTALRKKILKLDDIYPYDMLCPLFPEYDLEVKYEQAVAHLLESIGPLGQTYREVLERAMKSRWVDVYETQGKGGGAYSYGDNVNTHPFVLMNYNDTAESMFTLAHEMGHAMHSHMANTTQPYPKARYSIFVAEVASTLNEGLLLQHLLKRVKETGERLYLLDRQLNGT